MGEASPNAFYDEDAASVMEKLVAAGPFLRSIVPESPEAIAEAWAAVWEYVAPSRAAQCAVDLALWDWAAKRAGKSVSEMVWGEVARPIRTFCTIGISSEEELATKLAEMRGFPDIKIKSDSAAELQRVRTIREATGARCAVDANCAWGEADLQKLCEELATMGTAFVEQPYLPAENDRLMAGAFAVPIMADESCVTEADVDAVCRGFDGFNIKLVKCGGLTPALRMLARGRALGRKVMVGCMLESSCLIAAGAVLAQRCDYADLDGAWLLADDPCQGWRFSAGTLNPPAEPGLGTKWQKDAFAAG